MFSQEQWGQLLANFIEEAKELIQQAEAQYMGFARETGASID